MLQLSSSAASGTERASTFASTPLAGAACSGVLLACWVALVQSHWREWEDRWQWLMVVAPPPEETDW